MADTSGDPGIAKNIFVGYFVLILHVVLLVLLGVFIVFFRGLVAYMPWILGGGLLLLTLSGYLFYRRFKKNSQSLKQALNDTVPKDRPMEISLLGGLASLRVGVPSAGGNVSADAPLQLEDPETSRLRSLDRLADMYNKGLITKEEFALLKQDVLNSSSQSDSAGSDVIDVDFTSH